MRLLIVFRPLSAALDHVCISRSISKYLPGEGEGEGEE